MGAAETEAASGGPATEEPGTTVDCTSDEDVETGMCGADPAELRESNLAYADRIPFSGDRQAASVAPDRARVALAPFAGARPGPSPEQARVALAPVGVDIVVSDNAVRTAGVAFAVGVEGGCVFGSVYDGSIEIEVGGYVNDGGCLAEYGH